MVKVGIVITTHGNHGSTVRRCLQSVIKHTKETACICVFDNESTDEQTLSIPTDFPTVFYFRVDDQTKNGGLTATWNDGARFCIDRGCDVVVLLNHDTAVDATFIELEKAVRAGPRGAFGPISNAPDRSKHNAQNFAQLQLCSDGISNASVRSQKIKVHREGVASGVNGFCIAFSKDTLLENSIEIDGREYFFDSRLPFGGNENEWLFRWNKHHSNDCFVVRSCFVFHAKHSEWLAAKQDLSKVIYTTTTTDQLQKNSFDVHVDAKTSMVAFCTDIFEPISIGRWMCIPFPTGFLPPCAENIDTRDRSGKALALCRGWMWVGADVSVWFDGNTVSPETLNLLENVSACCPTTNCSIVGKDGSLLRHHTVPLDAFTAELWQQCCANQTFDVERLLQCHETLSCL